MCFDMLLDLPYIHTPETADAYKWQDEFPRRPHRFHYPERERERSCCPLPQINIDLIRLIITWWALTFLLSSARLCSHMLFVPTMMRDSNWGTENLQTDKNKANWRFTASWAFWLLWMHVKRALASSLYDIQGSFLLCKSETLLSVFLSVGLKRSRHMTSFMSVAQTSWVRCFMFSSLLKWYEVKRLSLFATFFEDSPHFQWLSAEITAVQSDTQRLILQITQSQSHGTETQQTTTTQHTQRTKYNHLQTDKTLNTSSSSPV